MTEITIKDQIIRECVITIDNLCGRLENACRAANKTIPGFWQAWAADDLISEARLMSETLHDSIPDLRGDFIPEPEDKSDIICQSCGDPDCNRPFPHS